MGPLLQLEEKYCCLGISKLRKLKNLEEENAQVKKLLADLSFDKQILQDMLKKNSEAVSKTGDGQQYSYGI